MVQVYFNSIRKEFWTQCSPDSWICFYFQNHQIIPTYYTLRSKSDGYDALVNFEIDVSIGNSILYEIDKQCGGPPTDGRYATFPFSIDNNEQKEAKYIRLTQTGKNSRLFICLCFAFSEFVYECLK